MILGLEKKRQHQKHVHPNNKEKPFITNEVVLIYNVSNECHLCNIVVVVVVCCFLFTYTS